MTSRGYPETDSLPEVDLNELPEVVADAVKACKRYVWTSLGLELDFTSETLPLLDHYCITARADLAEQPALAPLLGQAVGAYYGTVLGRVYPGFWLGTGPDVHSWRYCFTRVLLAINPVGFAWDALHDGEQHEGPSSELLLPAADRERVRSRLQALPAVGEADYYRLSTRFDALEIAVSELLREADAEGADWFEVEDYTDLFRRLGG